MEKLKATLFDAKNITAAGGIVVAILALGVIYKIITNDFAHVELGINQHNADTQAVQRETNEVLRNVATALEGNTRVIQQAILESQRE